MDSMGGYERTSDRMRPDGCTHTLLVRPHEGQNLRDADQSLPVDPPVTDEVARRPVGGDETRAANRAWWDGEAEDYYAEHGAFLGDAAFVWGPEGWTEAELDRVFTAYGVVPFVADSAAAFREAARVLRPGGRLAFSTSHPVRWAFPDDPGPDGLTVTSSYFDRTPYVESEAGGVTYAEHPRTVGDLVRQVVGAGLVLVDLVEPEWPAGEGGP